MKSFNKLVFINCPFDSAYSPLFEAIAFAIIVCEYRPRCALEIVDSGYSRLTKIVDLIDLCDFSLHDISRTDFPRFNMPFELGIAFGRKYLKSRGTASKMLVLDREPHRYLEFFSDLRGCDPVSHNDNAHNAIEHVRNWLSSYQQTPLNAPNHLNGWFDDFLKDLPDICRECGIERAQLSFNDLIFSIRFWVEANLPIA